MEVLEIVEKINSKEIQKKDIAKQLGINPSTLQRRLKKEGFNYDKEADLWTKSDSAVRNPEIQEVSKPEKKESIKKESNPSSKEEIQEENKQEIKKVRKAVKKVTYEIEEGLHDDLKIKAIREKRNVSEIVEQAIRQYLTESVK